MPADVNAEDCKCESVDALDAGVGTSPLDSSGT